MPADPIALHRMLEERYALEELRTLCFQLHVDYESLPGEGKAAKARELVSHMQRRDRLEELAAAIAARAKAEAAPAPPPLAEPVELRPEAASATTGGHPYDVFISYSHHDKDWVRGELLPQLERAGLRVCIDYRDFEIGTPSLVNMERAVDNCRHTLIVLTPDWINSEWTEFESLLAGTGDPAGRRRKLIPLMLKPCKLPPRIAMLTYADFTQPSERGAQMARLIKSLRNLAKVPEPLQASSANNPFGDVGRIADPAHFFDREELLRQIFEELGKGGNLSLVGESQVGKSSLLAMVCTTGPERMSKPPESFAYLNLEVVENEDDFYAALCEALHVEECRGYQLTRALRGKRYVLCLDEIEKMAWKGFTARVRSQLRGLADGADMPLKLVIASRTPLARLFPDSPEMDSPLAGICHQLDVGPFTPEAARAFLAHRLCGTGVTFGESEIAALLRETGGHPAKLQRAAADLYRRHTSHEL